MVLNPFSIYLSFQRLLAIWHAHRFSHKEITPFIFFSDKHWIWNHLLHCIEITPVLFLKSCPCSSPPHQLGHAKLLHRPISCGLTPSQPKWLTVIGTNTVECTPKRRIRIKTQTLSSISKSNSIWNTFEKYIWNSLHFLQLLECIWNTSKYIPFRVIAKLTMKVPMLYKCMNYPFVQEV